MRVVYHYKYKLIFEPDRDSSLVGGKPFGIGHYLGAPADRGQTLFGHALDLHLLAKTFYRKRAKHFGVGPGGQDVVEAGNVVAARFRGVVAKKDRPGVIQTRKYFLVIFGAYFQVFG